MTIRSLIETIAKGRYGNDCYVYHRDHTEPASNREFLISSADNKFQFSYGWWWRPKDRWLKMTFGRNGSESDIGLDACVIGLHWFARWKSPATKRFRIPQPETTDHNMPWYSSRHTGFHIGYVGNICGFEIEAPGGMWSSKTSEEIVLEEGRTLIPMPEGMYEATWKKSKYQRTYKRWPGKALQWWQDTKYRADAGSIRFDIPTGLPHWGKGENSWDCGMDGLFGLGFSLDDGDSINGYAQRAANRAMESRQKYGMFELPHPMTATAAEEFLMKS